MTESVWLSTESPTWMFQHVKARLSGRKLQLLACGCCRLLDRWLTDTQRAELAVVERYADGMASDDDYQQAKETFLRGVNPLLIATPTGNSLAPTLEAAVAGALVGTVSQPLDVGMRRVLELVEAAGARAGGPGGPREVRREISRRMCLVFHEVVGNPFHERVVAGPEWLAAGRRAAPWMLRVGETPRAIALGVQADRAFDRMPILADALEDDGCNDADLLAHFRHQPAHLRGCWALDLVLGKS